MLLLALLSPASALEEVPDYTRGVTQFRELEFEQAVLSFQSAAVQPDLSASEQARVLMYLGLCYTGIGDRETASSYFTQALERDRAITFPEAQPHPTAVKLFEEARASLPPDDATSRAPLKDTAPDDGMEPAGDGVAAGEESSDGLSPLVLGGAGVAAAAVVPLVIGVLASGAAVVLTLQINDIVSKGGFASDVNNAVMLRFVALAGVGGAGALTIALLAGGAATAAAGLTLE